MKMTEFYLFVLAALLIGAVYYVGVRTDLGAFTNLLTSVGNTYTGRPPGGGAFSGYPATPAGATA